MPSRLLPDTLNTLSSHLIETLQTPIRHPLDTHQILTKYQKCRPFPSDRILVWVVVLLLAVLVLVVTGGKQSQHLLQPAKVELGVQVGVEFDS